MNDNLIITDPNILGFIANVNNESLNFAEIKILDHPKLPNFDRYIQLIDLNVRSKQEYAIFGYKQVLKDKVSEEIFNIDLPTPEWVVYSNTWSYMRNENNEIIHAPLKPNSTDLDTGIKLTSYKYMLFLLKTNKAGFIQLIQSYLQLFVDSQIDALNA
jgi:hypothetical protein